MSQPFRLPAPPHLVRAYEEWQERNMERYGPREEPLPLPRPGSCQQKMIMERGPVRYRINLPDRFFWEDDELFFDEEGLGGEGEGEGGEGPALGTETWVEDFSARQTQVEIVLGVSYQRVQSSTFVRPNGDRITLQFGAP